MGFNLLSPIYDLKNLHLVLRSKKNIQKAFSHQRDWLKAIFLTEGMNNFYGYRGKLIIKMFQAHTAPSRKFSSLLLADFILLYSDCC